MNYELYIYDKELQPVGIIDTYQSLIWSTRYAELGDCEIYIEATSETLDVLRKDYFITRLDDDMVCQIKKVELDTNAETGNFLIVTGYDAKRFLDQRIVWGTATCDGSLELFIRDLVTDALISPDDPGRAIPDFELGAAAGFTEAMNAQVSYVNIGEKVREYCKKHGWGYRVRLDSGKFKFELYEGIDRTDEVVFSDQYENLATTEYIEDDTKLGNAALIAGEGEGSERLKEYAGSAEGMDRHEIYVDAHDLSCHITYEELITVYPIVENGGEGSIESDGSGGYVYKMGVLDVLIVDENQLEELETDYPDGTVVTVSGNDYYRVEDVVIADLPVESPESTETVVLREIIYSVYLLTRGYEKLSEFGQIVSFSGTVEPSTTFEYKKDYFLGDKVTVENEFGISAEARIVEIVEVADENGYRVEPKFEYKLIGG